MTVELVSAANSTGNSPTFIDGAYPSYEDKSIVFEAGSSSSSSFEFAIVNIRFITLFQAFQ